MAGELIGARPLVAGPILTAPGGHGSRQGIAIEVSGVGEIRDAVRTLASQGADVIKVATASASAMSQLSLAELKAASAEASRCALPVAAHAHFNHEDVRRALEGGCTTLEHGTTLHMLDGAGIEEAGKEGRFTLPHSAPLWPYSSAS